MSGYAPRTTTPNTDFPSPQRFCRRLLDPPGLGALLSAPRLAVELRGTADDKQKGKTKMRNLGEETDDSPMAELRSRRPLPSWHHPLVPRQPDASLLLFASPAPAAPPPSRPAAASVVSI